MKVLNIVGARPNFMKVAPVHQAMLDAGIDAQLIHTGQHYDKNMSDIFFEQLGMPKPDVHLHVGSASHAVQTAEVMTKFETVVEREAPDWVLVAGDVNSTLACALVAAKLHIRVAHLEAGLRSGDRTMPEELNRLATDVLADLLLTPSPDADENLRREGIDKARVVRVGNAMIDSLLTHRDRAVAEVKLDSFGVDAGGFGLMTLHRPSNVDASTTLQPLLEAIATIAEQVPILFPAHPRTKARIAEFGLEHLIQDSAIRMLEPLGYLEFLALQAQAKVVMTDSGGIQEETTALGVPCLTIRENTERPITITEGTNTLVGTDPAKLLASAKDVLETGGKTGRVPDLWDGRTGPRVAKALLEA